MSADRTCIYCGQPVYAEPNVGWVSAINGDDGGTYDVCEDSPTQTHRPHPASLSNPPFPEGPTTDEIRRMLREQQ